jgi:hypothetical protein
MRQQQQWKQQKLLGSRCLLLLSRQHTGRSSSRFVCTTHWEPAIMGTTASSGIACRARPPLLLLLLLLLAVMLVVELKVVLTPLLMLRSKAPKMQPWQQRETSPCWMRW